jgi:arginase family enzyme
VRCYKPTIQALGRSDADDFPKVLVNTDAHSDLFDSESEDASDFEELISV